MAMKYRYVSNGKYKTRRRPGPVDAIMMAHRAKPNAFVAMWQQRVDYFYARYTEATAEKK